jgi:Ca2+-binding RTX toxin-like protein
MSRSNQPRPWLRLDTLESRALMTVTYNPATDVVTVTGTNAADTYRCYQVGNLLTIEEGVAPAVGTSTFDLLLQPVVRISVDLQDGGDRFVADPSVQVPVWASGGPGADAIVGGSKADNLSGGDQNDVLDGGVGNDTLTGGNHSDNITGGNDHDTISAGDGNDTVAGGDGNDTIDGFWGVDRIHGDSGDDTIYGDIGNDLLWGDKGFDYIDGGVDSEDRIWGGTENDTLIGSSGNDHIWGEQGTDTLDGSEGHDVLDGGTENDTLAGSADRDTLTGGDGNDDLDGGTENDSLFGDGIGAAAPGDDTLHGGAGNDRVNGDAGADLLFGDGNNDSLTGGTGNDTADGGAGNDTVRGGDGQDRLYGKDGADQLFGDNQNDQLYGDQGADSLDGGANDDTLVSIDDFATDTLTGGTGKDSFWADQSGNAFDLITGATAAETDTNTHFVDAFANGADKVLDGDGISDPTGGESSADFAGVPLFSESGPRVADIDQGDLADCWLLASLAAAVDVSPNVARQLIVDLGDGTYAVHTQDALLGTDEYFRVDTDLPVTQDDPTKPQFAGLGANGSLWVALVEKAWAIDKNNDYMNLESQFDPFSQTGTSYYPLGQIGGTNRNLYPISDGSAVLGDIAANDWAGTYWTRTSDEDAMYTVDSHCYAILSSETDANGLTIVHLYNPHGEDRTPLYNEDGSPMLNEDGEQMKGYTDDANDGFVTLTLDQFVHDAQGPVGAITADFNAYK